MIGKLAIGAVVFVVGLSILGTGADNPSEPTARFEKLMFEHDLTFPEAKAFKACKSQMKRHDFKPKSGITMFTVPEEICVCQSRTMAQHFKLGKNYDHFLVLAYASGSGTNTSLDSDDLIDPANPRQQFMALVNSVNLCAKETSQAINQKSLDRLEDICSDGTLTKEKCDELRVKMREP